MKHKNSILTVFFALILFTLSVTCWLKPHTEYSEGERRLLAKKPILSTETVLSGEFMKEFESYVTDQFPARDAFRTVKAIFSTYGFQKMDNNGLFVADGHISKLEYPVNSKMVDNAAEKLAFLYDSYMKDKDVNVYLSIVPDKNYFLAKENGYLSIDYDAFIKDFQDRMANMQYIDILPLLSLEDYYRTDSHWKQESITDIASHIAQSMGTDASADFAVNTLENPFRGVYLGQSALAAETDTIKYLTNEILSGAKVTYFDTGKAQAGDMYNMEKAFGKDPYELFLSGTSALLTIENPHAKTDKELVMFRDSFGSSLAPLLVPGYKKITVIDIRYVQSAFVGNFVKFQNQDVLFIYSTTLLNNSMAMR